MEGVNFNVFQIDATTWIQERMFQEVGGPTKRTP